VWYSRRSEVSTQGDENRHPARFVRCRSVSCMPSLCRMGFAAPPDSVSKTLIFLGVPCGIRTRVAAVRGRHSGFCSPVLYRHGGVYSHQAVVARPAPAAVALHALGRWFQRSLDVSESVLTKIYKPRLTTSNDLARS